MKKRMRSLVIVGRRWWKRRTGATYHSVEIIIDGEIVHKVPYSYGYGSSFEDSAASWLHANGYMPGRQHYEHSGGDEGITSYCERHNIPRWSTVTDVTRRSDL